MTGISRAHLRNITLLAKVTPQPEMSRNVYVPASPAHRFCQTLPSVRRAHRSLSHPSSHDCVTSIACALTPDHPRNYFAEKVFFYTARSCPYECIATLVDENGRYLSATCCQKV